MAEGLRERRKEAIRQEVSQAGIKLFLKQGFEKTTIDEIVGPLGISRRTFFRHFETKEDLVFVWYEDLTKKLVTACAARPSEETPYEAVCAALRGLLELYDANPKWAKKMVKLASETPALVGKSHEKRAMWGRALAATIAKRMDKSPERDLYAEIIASTAINAFALSVDTWYAEGGTRDLRATVNAGLACAGQVGRR